MSASQKIVFVSFAVIGSGQSCYFVGPSENAIMEFTGGGKKYGQQNFRSWDLVEEDTARYLGFADDPKVKEARESQTCKCLGSGSSLGTKKKKKNKR